MKQSIGNVNVTTINAMYEELIRLDSTQLKPFQVHFMEDVVLMKEFISNQKTLNGKNNKCKNAFDMLGDVILDKQIVGVHISVGKEHKNNFDVYLHVHTNSPRIMIGNWDKTEPTFCISDGNYRFANTICSINLAYIQNLYVANKQVNDFNVYSVRFSCGIIDYRMTIKTNI